MKTTITTEGGTTFIVNDGNITISRTDQPKITIPEDDLDEFWSQYADSLSDDDDDDFEDQD